ncbi:muscle M-line assembly protein unc-89-like [Centruroides sculpturatus]|uniref:muscle M-line assembly protein unc-89-like n=1 Tax=Centruroides sculpturatus TaxID=218467 RepID=UPI000C6EB773|nr:muscle M-line assembly protein unc-89-like [Centruroides sculpturatus]
MGSNFTTATIFVDLHKQFHADVKMKSKDIEALIDSCSTVMTISKKALNEIQKKDEIHQRWRKLCNMIEKRIYLSESYVLFHQNYKEIYENIVNVEKLFKQARDKSSVSEDIERKRISLECDINNIRHSGTAFIEAAYKLEDPYLDTKSAISCVERLLKNLKNHYDDMNTIWTAWKSQLAEKDRQIWEQFCRDVEMTTENVHRLEGNLFPILSRDMDQVGIVVEYLKRCSDDTAPKIKQIQSEVEAYFKRSDFISPSSTLKEEEAVMKSKLQSVYAKLQKDVASYQILVANMNALFHNLKELDNLIEKLQSEYRTTVLSQDATQAEIQLQKLDTTHTTITELFKKVEEEAKELINKISELEPFDAARKDKEKILYFIKTCKDQFTVLLEEQKKKMKDNLQMCHFNAEFKDINREIDDVQKQLKSIENSFRDSLDAAKQALWTFRDLQKGVEHLDQKIRIFMGTFKYSKSDSIQREIEALRIKWTSIQAEISKVHHLINIAIECFQLIEEAKDWFKEGSQLLVTIARKSSLCKTTNDAERLLKEVEDFLSTGKIKQEERFYKISILVLQLFEGKTPSIVQQLTIRSKDMSESLEVIKKELYSLIENLKAAEEEQAKEKIIKDIKAEASRQFHSEFSTIIHKPIEISEKQVTTIHTSSPKIIRKEIIESPKLQRRTINGKPPIFTVPLNDSQVQEGSKFVFYCQIEAGHNPIVRWYKNDMLIYNNPDYAIGLENNICTLTIEETLLEDSAVYTCKVENEFGKAESSAHLHVKETRPRIEPPHFTKELEPGKVKERESFKFTCQVTGNPLPLVSWYKKDVCIDSSPDYVIIFNNGFCQLHIKEAHLEDEGCYSCRATNKAGQAECSATLNIISLFPIEAPAFLIPLSNVTVRSGHNLHLECQIRGYPSPVLTWSHNGVILKENSNTRLRFDQNKAVLEKPIATLKDSGTYTITARNLAGEAISSSYVCIKEKLILEASDSDAISDTDIVKPIIKEALESQQVYVNGCIQLDCVIIGNPEPEVIWYHNGKPVKESDKLKLLFEGDRCSLILKDISLSDAGSYRCVAINPAGEASSECTISVKSDSPSHKIYKEFRVLEERITSPKFVQLLEDITLSKGKNMKLQCKVIGESELTIFWYKDGQKLHNSSKYKIDNDHKTGHLSLTIYDVNQSDEGKYVVQALNKYGEAKCYCSILASSPKVPQKPIVPEIPPKFLILLRNTHVIKGQEAKFDCLISGTPKPAVTWYFEDKPLSRSESYIITEDGHRQSLVVLNTSDKNSGRYSVTAENNSGKATSSAYLTVESPTKSVWNGIEERKTSQKTLLSQSNFTNRTLHQESNLFELHQTTSVGYHEEIQKANFDVSKLNHTAISATETATVSYGLSSRRIPPTVSVKPSKSLPPKFVKPVECAVVEVGEDIILQGQIEGYPEPSVTWSLGDKEIFPKSGLSISFSDNVAALKISKATERDSGRYTCTASNSAGVASSTADVIVRPHRNPPKFVHPLQPCLFKSGDRVQLDVEVMGTPLPQVKWYHNGTIITDSLSFYTMSEGTKHSLVIPNATSDHSGKLTVKAINAGGEAQCTVDLIHVDNASLVGKAVSYREMSVVQQTEKVTLTSEK